MKVLFHIYSSYQALIWNESEEPDRRKKGTLAYIYLQEKYFKFKASRMSENGTCRIHLWTL